MHITPESKLHFQTTCFLLHRLYQYVLIHILIVSVIATDFQGSHMIPTGLSQSLPLFDSVIIFFLPSGSAYPRKECVCKPLSQFMFLDTRIIPFGISVYLGQGETLPTQQKNWQHVEFDLTSVFQSSFPHFRPWHPHLLLEPQQRAWMQLLCHREFVFGKSSTHHRWCGLKAQPLDLELVLLPRPYVPARQLIRLKWLL